MASPYGNFPAGGPSDLADVLDQYGARWNDEFKKRGMLTVPTKNVSRVTVGFDSPRLSAALSHFKNVSAPFHLFVEKHESISGAHYTVSINHSDFGYATRRIASELLDSPSNINPLIHAVEAVIEDMKKELGFKQSQAEKEDAVPIVPAAQSQHHTCGKHGNQLVAARNEETGETALRCPVVGCTTILRKRRKSTLVG